MATLQYKSSLGRYRRYLQTVQAQPLLKASLFLILSLLLIIILVLAALRPTLITIASLLGQINSQQQLAAQLDHKIATIREAQQQLAAVSSRLVYLDAAIPTQADISLWTNSVQKVASESGVAANNISLSDLPVGRVSQPNLLAFKLNVVGPYDRVYQFLQFLESLRRLVKLDKIAVTRDSKDGTQMTFDISGALEAAP